MKKLGTIPSVCLRAGQKDLLPAVLVNVVTAGGVVEGGGVESSVWCKGAGRS